MSAEETFGFRGSASARTSFLEAKDAALSRRLEEAKARAAEAEAWRDEALEARTRIPELEMRAAQLEDELRKAERQVNDLRAETASRAAAQEHADELVAAAEEFAAWYAGGPATEKTRRAARRLLRA